MNLVRRCWTCQLPHTRWECLTSDATHRVPKPLGAGTDASDRVPSNVAGVRRAHCLKPLLATQLTSLLTEHSIVFQLRPVLEHRTHWCNTICCEKTPACTRRWPAWPAPGECFAVRNSPTTSLKLSSDAIKK